MIDETATGPRRSRTYGISADGLAEIGRWLTETAPDRRERSDATLRTFFLWLLEPDDAAEHLERERVHVEGLLAELEAIREQPFSTARKERAFRLALEGGIRATESRLEWIAWALEQVRSEEWSSADASTAAEGSAAAL